MEPRVNVPVTRKFKANAHKALLVLPQEVQDDVRNTAAALFKSLQGQHDLAILQMSQFLTRRARLDLLEESMLSIATTFVQNPGITDEQVSDYLVRLLTGLAAIKFAG